VGINKILISVSLQEIPMQTRLRNFVVPLKDSFRNRGTIQDNETFNCLTKHHTQNTTLN